MLSHTLSHINLKQAFEIDLVSISRDEKAALELRELLLFMTVMRINHILIQHSITFTEITNIVLYTSMSDF